MISGMLCALMIGKQTMQHEPRSIAHVDGFQNIPVGWRQFLSLKSGNRGKNSFLSA